MHFIQEFNMHNFAYKQHTVLVHMLIQQSSRLQGGNPHSAQPYGVSWPASQ